MVRAFKALEGQDQLTCTEAEHEQFNLPAAGTPSTVHSLVEECLQCMVEDQSQFWDWRFGSRIHYRTAGTTGPAIVLVHGFGVASFQFQDLMDELSKTHRVWALDLLGMGLSWPQANSDESGTLAYSIDMWTEQLVSFMEEVVAEPAFVAGNSLGGLLAASLGAARPDLCRGICFLNATPFWAFMPQRESIPRALTALLPWDGTLPPPPPIRFLIQNVWWRALRQKRLLQSLLKLVYRNRQLVDEKLVESILAPTQHPGALDAFVSLLFAPKPRLDFNSCARALTCPITMVYGREDPWVVPLWGQRLKRLLPQADYFEVSPAGHCPHAEAPAAVSEAMQMWISAAESSSPLPLAIGDTRQLGSCGLQLMSGHPRNVFERLDALAWSLRNKLLRRK
ncbi:hypothetical protein WJX84_005938 [Apatococcus fuscideae]|uniref:AB hydrolase-1 domain-containing protein n=1 Tax=Apatococcus fuscideae TaxID=2026836 RepID=A0AAW1S1W3_9CHLO